MKKLNSYLLIALALTACTSNLHALTKTRAFAQAATTVAHTAANYARKNKLKTAGMVIGGIIALDSLQLGIRYIYQENNPFHQAKIKKSKEELKSIHAANQQLFLKYHHLPENDAEKQSSLTAWTDHTKNTLGPKENDFHKLSYFDPVKNSLIFRWL